MGRNAEVAHYLAEFPLATNSDIAESLMISEGNAKRIVSELKRVGAIEVTKNEDGLRNITVDMSRVHNAGGQTSERKVEIIEETIDILMEALRKETRLENIKDGINSMIKLIDRM